MQITRNLTSHIRSIRKISLKSLRSSTIQPLPIFSTCVWQLSIAQPTLQLLTNMRRLYDTTTDSWASSSKQKHTRPFQVLLYFLSCALHIIELRYKSKLGRRNLEKARKHSKAYPLHLRSTLMQKHPYQNHHLSLLVDFIIPQFDSMLGPKTSHNGQLLYQLPVEKDNYIGRSQDKRTTGKYGGPTHKLKEHLI